MPRRSHTDSTRDRAKPPRPVYVRACPECGHATFSFDRALMRRDMTCPSCEPKWQLPLLTA